MVVNKLIFISQQCVVRPSSLVIYGCNFDVIDEFKLPGITIDPNLLFNKYVDRLKFSVNKIFTIGIGHLQLRLVQNPYRGKRGQKVDHGFAFIIEILVFELEFGLGHT